MWPPEGLSAPSPLLIGWSLGPPRGAAGASEHLLQAVPKVPQGTGGQGTITQATSTVPCGVSLEGLLAIGLIATLGKAFAVTLGLHRPIPGCPRRGVSAWWPPEQLGSQVLPLLHFQTAVPEARTFFANLCGNNSPKL